MLPYTRIYIGSDLRLLQRRMFKATFGIPPVIARLRLDHATFVEDSREPLWGEAALEPL